MKKHMLLFVALSVGCSMFVLPGSSPSFAKGGPSALARGGDQGHGEHRGKDNRGQRKKWEREKDGRYRFAEFDHRAAEDYYRAHRNDRAFRKHWRNGGGPPIAYGYVIAPRYRSYCRPIPVVLVRELGPPPLGYRYYLFNGDVVLVDDGYRVQDFIHLDINIGL